MPCSRQSSGAAITLTHEWPALYLAQPQVLKAIAGATAPQEQPKSKPFRHNPAPICLRAAQLDARHDDRCAERACQRQHLDGEKRPAGQHLDARPEGGQRLGAAPPGIAQRQDHRDAQQNRAVEVSCRADHRGQHKPRPAQKNKRREGRGQRARRRIELHLRTGRRAASRAGGARKRRGRSGRSGSPLRGRSARAQAA